MSTEQKDGSVSNWVDEANRGETSMSRPRMKSVCDFDYSEVAMWESKKVSELNSEELLKMLIVRGHREKNPVLWKGGEGLLKQINGERFRPEGERRFSRDHEPREPREQREPRGPREPRGQRHETATSTELSGATVEASSRPTEHFGPRRRRERPMRRREQRPNQQEHEVANAP